MLQRIESTMTVEGSTKKVNLEDFYEEYGNDIDHQASFNSYGFGA